jgi:hypothetical protein
MLLVGMDRRRPSLERVAAPCAVAVAAGGFLYGALFAWIVVGAPGWVPKV